jgi:phosphoglycolate phosphatase-like HAD superfamily hydrolase
MVGDSISDIEAGNKSNVKTIYVGNDIISNANFNFVNIMEFVKHFEDVLRLTQNEI